MTAAPAAPAPVTPPEFSRPQSLDRIGDNTRPVVIEAAEAERRALAARFGLGAVEALSATCTLRRDATGITVAGMVHARVVQLCVVTGDALPVALDAPLTLRFVPEGVRADDDIELSQDALDVIPFSGGAIELGEAVAETMALALDPFPRGPRADEALRAAGVLQEGEAGPFGALAALRDSLSGER